MEVDALEPSRRQALLELASITPGASIAHKLCTVSLGSRMDGAVILLQQDRSPTGVSASSGTMGHTLAQLELTLGEGPGHQAANFRAAVFADQLLTGPCERWPVFSTQAREQGIGSVFAFPLCLGSIYVGVFELCRTRSGKLTASELTDLSLLASLATSALLLMQSGLADGDLFDLLEAGNPAQLSVHQATGMVAQQASVSLADALALIRAYALANDLPLVEVAELIITRKIRMDNT